MSDDGSVASKTNKFVQIRSLRLSFTDHILVPQLLDARFNSGL